MRSCCCPSGHPPSCVCCEECVGRQDLRKRGLLFVLDRTGGACRVVNDLPSIGSPVIVLTSFVHQRQVDGLVRVAGRVVFYLITSSGPPLLFPSPKLRGNSNHRCLRWVLHALMHFTVNLPLWRGTTTDGLTLCKLLLLNFRLVEIPRRNKPRGGRWFLGPVWYWSP
jgi:hypothetical protein